MIRVGEKLKEERRKQNLTVDQVAKATKIRPQFITAIEEGMYEKLPVGSYAHGFVKNYIALLGLPEKELMALFRREYDTKEHQRLMPESFVGKEAISLKRFSLSRTVWLIALVIFALFIYLFYQYRAAFFPPYLSISSPKEKEVISSQTVLVTGSTDANTAVTVNNLPTFVDSTGKFTKEVPVFPGNVVLSVKAVNSFGKMTEIDRHVTITVGQ